MGRCLHPSAGWPFSPRSCRRSVSNHWTAHLRHAGMDPGPLGVQTAVLVKLSGYHSGSWVESKTAPVGAAFGWILWQRVASGENLTSSRVPYGPSAWGANPRTNASVRQAMPGLRTFVRWTAGGDRGDPSCGFCSPIMRVLLLGFSPGSGRHYPADRDGDSMLQSVAAKPISGRRGSPAKLVERVVGQFGRLQSRLRGDKLGRDSPAEGGGCQQLHGAQSRETLLRLSSPTI